jgi:hypothetical protein
VSDPAPPLPTSSLPSEDPRHKPITAPLAVWLLAQLTVLVLAISRVALSANFIRPAEALAMDEMLVVQFAVSAMLFPFLLRDLRCSIALILTAAPMLQLAGTLSESSAGQVLGAWTCVAIWLIALALWRRAIAPRYRPVGVAVANLLTLGGLLLWYLAREFPAGSSFAQLLPLPAVTRFAQGQRHLVTPLLSTVIWLVLAVAALLVTRRCARRRP